MKTKWQRTRNVAAGLILGCGLLSGPGCIRVPDNFWIDQWNFTLATAWATVVGDTIVPAIDNAFLPSTE